MLRVDVGEDPGVLPPDEDINSPSPVVSKLPSGIQANSLFIDRIDLQNAVEQSPSVTSITSQYSCNQRNFSGRFSDSNNGLCLQFETDLIFLYSKP